ncbi:MAG: transketolase family protein [Candidatus Bathyarchaeota archaeon]|nr:transketolase family protein [Candidatus Bathyarchaeota archaeon]
MSEKYLRDQPGEMKMMYTGHNEALIELAEENRDVVTLYADFPQDEAGKYFKDKYPHRLLNLGIAEGNMITVAGGLAAGGKIPFTHCHNIFAIGRGYNQIRQLAFDKLNVKIVLCNSGMLWGFMGASHQMIEDIASLRTVPDLVLVSPADAVEAKKTSKAAVEYDGPVAIRIAQPELPVIYNEDYTFQIGKAVKLKEGSDLTIFSTGIMVLEALEAADLLSKDGIDARVINMHTLKPADGKAIKEAALETGAIVTVEDSNILGGLGGIVAEVVTENVLVPLQRIGARDRFGQTGSIEELKAEYNLTKIDIAKAAKEVVKRKKT